MPPRKKQPPSRQQPITLFQGKLMTLNLKSKTLKFSVSGMRGLFPEDLNAGNIPEIVRAFEASLPKGAIALATDNRPTGAAIEQLATGVLLSLGRDVHSLGVVPTPTIKAYINQKKLAGGLMISASHNPMHYNAFKFIKKGGFFFDQAQNDLLQKNLSAKNLSWGEHTRQGVLTHARDEAIALHLNSILKTVPGAAKKGKKLKVAVDTLGACATGIIEELLDSLGVETVSLFDQVIPKFQRPPEPTPPALKKLGKLVVEKKCDLGFAFDPDADRLALVNSDGKPIGEELTLPLAMLQALQKKKGKIVVNLSSSYYNNLAAQMQGCSVLRSKVGEANVVEMMQQKKALFGGEGNGGVIDPKIPSYGRDSLIGVARIIALLKESKKPLHELVSQFQTLHMKKIAIKGDQKTVQKIATACRKSLKGYTEDKRDGFHFSAPSGLPWVHIRPSNTEPIIRVIAEAASAKELKEILAIAGG